MARILSWIVSIFFSLAAIGGFLSSDIWPSLFATIIALLAFPPLWRSSGFKKIPTGARWAVAIPAIIAMIIAVPHSSNQSKGNATTAEAVGKDTKGGTQDGSSKPSAITAADTPSAPEASAKVNQNNWEYQQSFDEMRKKYTYTACIKSDNQLNFGFPYWGGSSGQLCFRNSPQFGKDLYLAIDGGQFDCSFEGCTVRIKFDDGPIRSYGASEAADGTTNIIFIHGYSSIKRSIQKSKHMIIEAAYFQQGNQQLKFSVDGFNWKH